MKNSLYLTLTSAPVKGGSKQGTLALYGCDSASAAHAPSAKAKSLDQSVMESPGVEASAQKTILIVDDDAMIRAGLAAVFRSEKFQVRLAENGRMAVRRFLESSPDLILLDLNMPDVDGWKAFEVMARLAPSVPVIVITARPNQARRAAEAGVDMLLEKPLDIPMLLETVRNLLAAPEKSRFGQVLRAYHTHSVPESKD